MNRVMIVCGLVALLAAGFMAYPTGAPSSVCDDPFMEPTFHRDNFSAVGYNNTDQYTLRSQQVEGSSDLIQVTLSGDEFKGFVVRATTPGEDNLGEFIMNENTVPFNRMNCSKPKDVAVTQVSPDPRPSINLLWRDRNNGNHVFQATVVPDLDSYVINIFEK